MNKPVEMQYLIAFLRELQGLQDQVFQNSQSSTTDAFLCKNGEHNTRNKKETEEFESLQFIHQYMHSLCSYMHDVSLTMLEHVSNTTGPAEVIPSLLLVLQECIRNLHIFYQIYIVNKKNSTLMGNISGEEDAVFDIDVLQDSHPDNANNMEVEDDDPSDEDEDWNNQSESSADEVANGVTADELDRIQSLTSPLMTEFKNMWYFVHVTTKRVEQHLTEITVATLPSSPSSSSSSSSSSPKYKQQYPLLHHELSQMDTEMESIFCFVEKAMRDLMTSQQPLRDWKAIFFPFTSQNCNSVVVQLYWLKYFHKINKMITFKQWNECFEVEYGTQSRDALLALFQQMTKNESTNLEESYISITDVIMWIKDKAMQENHRVEGSCPSLFVMYQHNCFSQTLLILSGKCGMLNYPRPTIIHKFLGIPIRQVACGSEHIAVVSSCGELFTWGVGSFGRLGHGFVHDCKFPTKVLAFQRTPIERVNCGFASTYAISTIGQSYSWGSGSSGRLGLGDSNDRHRPCAMTTLEDIRAVDVSAGSVHVCILDSKGKIYSCGKAGYCGHGKGQDVLVPLWLDCFDGEEIQQISTSLCGFHSLALTKSGYLYSWGHARVGQVGITINDQSMRSDDGGKFLPIPHLVTENIPKNIAKVHAGWGHSCVLTTDGEVYMCGRNVEGQLGINVSYPGNSLRFNERNHIFQSTFLPIRTGDLIIGSTSIKRRVKDIACGGEFTLLIMEGNEMEVVGMGNCREGQLFLNHSRQYEYQTLPLPTFLSYFQQEKRNIQHISAGYSVTACVLSVLRQPPSLKKLCSDAIFQCPDLHEFLFPPALDHGNHCNEEEDILQNSYREIVISHLC